MKTITVSELKANVGKVVDGVLAGEPTLIFRNGKFAILRPVEVIPQETKLHQQWIDEALASGPAEEKTEADWQALKRRALSKRK
jgi:antitoxin (DNA-binding transcriptional repressor) of toxin-antitoxin stability system